LNKIQEIRLCCVHWKFTLQDSDYYKNIIF